MANITVTIPDQVYRAARVKAAERGSSVSALVADYLSSLSESESEFQRREAQQARVIAQIDRFCAGNRLSRDELHERAIR